MIKRGDFVARLIVLVLAGTIIDPGDVMVRAGMIPRCQHPSPGLESAEKYARMNARHAPTFKPRHQGRTTSLAAWRPGSVVGSVVLRVHHGVSRHVHDTTRGNRLGHDVHRRGHAHQHWAHRQSIANILQQIKRDIRRV
jgi:hypothetical protein